jgi:hypothetical protein
MAAKSRGFLVLVLGGNEPVGFVLVASLERLLLAGGVSLAVVNAPRAKEYTVTLFHVQFHGYEHEPSRSDLVSE